MPWIKVLPIVGAHWASNKKIFGRSRLQWNPREARSLQTRGANRSQTRHLKGKLKNHWGAVWLLPAPGWKRRWTLKRLSGPTLVVIFTHYLGYNAIIRPSWPDRTYHELVAKGQEDRFVSSRDVAFLVFLDKTTLFPCQLRPMVLHLSFPLKLFALFVWLDFNRRSKMGSFWGIRYLLL